MTLQEIKNKVAKDNGFRSWDDWKNQSLEIAGHSEIPEGWHDKISELYVDERVAEVIEAINSEIEKSKSEINNSIFGTSDKEKQKLFIAGLRKAKHLICGL